MSRGKVLQHRVSRVERPLQGDEALTLREACRRIGISYSYGRQLAMVGKFPLPCLPRLGPRGHFHFSPRVLAEYLDEASTNDARVNGR